LSFTLKQHGFLWQGGGRAGRIITETLCYPQVITYWYDLTGTVRSDYRVKRSHSNLTQTGERDFSLKHTGINIQTGIAAIIFEDMVKSCPCDKPCQWLYQYRQAVEKKYPFGYRCHIGK
jgi:hypothetical protein